MISLRECQINQTRRRSALFRFWRRCPRWRPTGYCVHELCRKCEKSPCKPSLKGSEANMKTSQSRRLFIQSTGAALGAMTLPDLVGQSGTTASQKKFNILYLCSDQQHWQAQGSVDPFFDTPHQDALSAESTVFENAFCTTPQCSPSRSSMLTGFYPHTTEMMNNSGRVWWNGFENIHGWGSPSKSWLHDCLIWEMASGQ